MVEPSKQLTSSIMRWITTGKWTDFTYALECLVASPPSFLKVLLMVLGSFSSTCLAPLLLLSWIAELFTSAPAGSDGVGGKTRDGESCAAGAETRDDDWCDAAAEAGEKAGAKVEANAGAQAGEKAGAKGGENTPGGIGVTCRIAMDENAVALPTVVCSTVGESMDERSSIMAR